MLYLKLNLHIQYTNQRPHVKRPIYRIPYKLAYITLKVISEPQTQYSVCKNDAMSIGLFAKSNLKNHILP
jgi:hypothetical protein